MKKNCLSIVISLMSFTSCQEHPKNAGDEPGATQDTLLSTSFYKRLEGTIAGQPVVMHMHKFQNKFEATYYYKKTGGWLTLSSDRVSGDSIYFSEYPPAVNFNDSDSDTILPQMKGSLKNNMLTGVWISKDHKVSYPVNLRESYPAGSYQFSFEMYSDSIKAFADKPLSPMAEIDNAFVTCQNNEWLNNQIKNVLTYDSSLNFRDGFGKAKAEYFNEYKQQLPPPGTTSENEFLNYSRSQNIYVRYNQKDFVILESADYMYSGGAHGNYGSTFYCFDVANKKQMKLKDILSADSATLQPVVEKYFRNQYGIKGALKEFLFENHLPANDNFFFNEQGVGFLYNPYEVASYAQGEISVFIPFSALRKYLQPDFRKRMGTK